MEQERPLAEYLRKLEERVKGKRSTNGNEQEDDEKELERPPLRVTIGDREIDLPSSVIHLKSRNGGDVFLIGSAHVSQASVDEVTQVISRVQPGTVFVELCPSRAGILFAPQHQEQPPNTPTEAKVADGREGESAAEQGSPAEGSTTRVEKPEKAPSTLNQITELLRRRKEGANILHLVISLVFERVTKNIKVMPGSEFRAAAQEGMKYGARVVLGDRPVEITLKRTWGNLSAWEKLKLMYFVLIDTSLDIKEEDIERMKNSDVITEMVKELSTEFPSLVVPLITERDQYLASKLRSCPGDVIVGVVGMGHVAGMVEWWDRDIDLRAICAVPPSGFLTIKRILLLVILSFFSLIGFLVYYLFF